MSYILDALRKSDQQRQRGTPPTLLAPQVAAVESTRRVSIPHVALAAVLVSAGAVIGSLRPWQSEQPPPVTEPAGMKPPESSARPSPAAGSVRPQPAREPEQQVPARKTASTARSASAPEPGAMARQMPAAAKSGTRAQTVTAPREDVPALPKERAKPLAAKPDGTGPGEAIREPSVMTIAELPPSIQQELPRISISVHAYSSTSRDRLIGINDRVLREGEDVAAGLRLEEITPDGMIMSYKGYRFRRGVR